MSSRVLVASALVALLARGALGATFTVTTSADSGAGSLRAAVVAANTAGGANTIVFSGFAPGTTIPLTTSDPSTVFPSVAAPYGSTALVVSSTLTIDGSATPGLFISGTNTLRIFAVTPNGNLTLVNLTLTQGLAQGGAGGDGGFLGSGGGGGGGAAGLGGALYVDQGASVALQGCLVSSSVARGGAGGSVVTGSPDQAAGGGGGLGGAGTSGTTNTVTPGGPPNAGAGGGNTLPGLAGGPGGGGGGTADFGASGGAGGFGGGGGGGLGGLASLPNGNGGTGGFGGGGGGGGDGAAPFSTPGSAGASAAFGGSGDPGSATRAGAGGGGAGLGGGIFVNAGTLTVTNSTITLCQAAGGGAGTGGAGGGSAGQGLGGAIFQRNGTLTLTAVTIANNTADDGGALYLLGDGATATLHAVGSILASSVTAPHDATGTTLNGGTDSITASSMNDIMTQTLGIPTSTTGDPKLGALAQNGGPTETLAPGAGSEAINNGMASGTDERGIARRSGFQDAGAFEAEAATLSVNSGGGQSAPAGAPFTNPIVVEAKDASGNDLGGVVLTLTPPGSGASATFTPPSPVTAANGQAQTNATANGTQGGPYMVNVSAPGGASTSFMLTNTAPIVASVTVVQGAGQSATVGTAFSQTIIIFAANGSGAGVSGQTFNLSVPSGGATLSTSQVTTDGTGHASFTATAGTHAPAFYQVLVTGAVSTHFGLVNLGGPPKNSLVAAGDKDGTLAGQPFPGAIVLLVTDSFDNPTNAVTPTFTPPSSGATATFSPPLESSIWGFYAFTATASPTAGGPYPVTVTAGSATATFDLVNVAPPSPAPPAPLVSGGGHGSGGCSLGGRAAPSSLSPLLLLLVFVLARRR